MGLVKKKKKKKVIEEEEDSVSAVQLRAKLKCKNQTHTARICQWLRGLFIIQITSKNQPQSYCLDFALNTSCIYPQLRVIVKCHGIVPAKHRTCSAWAGFPVLLPAAGGFPSGIAGCEGLSWLLQNPAALFPGACSGELSFWWELSSKGCSEQLLQHQQRSQGCSDSPQTLLCCFALGKIPEKLGTGCFRLLGIVQSRSSCCREGRDQSGGAKLI